MSCLESKVALAMSAGDGVKAGTAYSVIPASGAGDFTVVRNGINQRINKSLILENVAVNVPQVDWIGGEQVMRTQEAATALIADNVSFGAASWTKSGATIEGDASTAGEELVTNGDFASDISGWTNTASVVWGAAGVAEYVGTSGNFYQGILTVGKLYIITFDWTRTSGSLKVYCGGSTPSITISTSSSGTFSSYMYANSETNFNVQSSSFIGTIDNISVKEVTGFSSPHATYDDKAYDMVATTASQGIYQEFTSIAVTAGDKYTFSCGAKTLTQLVSFTGSAAGTDVYSYEALADGFYWQTITRTFTSTASSTIRVNIDNAIAGVGTYRLAFSQYEKSPHATSLMLNITEGLIDESSAATRVADVISLTDLQTNSLLGATTGTIVFSVTSSAAGSAKDLYVFKDTGAGLELGLRFNADETWQWYDHHSTALIGSKSASSSAKMGITWSGTGAIISVDGTHAGVTLTAAFDAITDITTSASFESGGVKTLIMTDSLYTAADLNALTS